MLRRAGFQRVFVRLNSTKTTSTGLTKAELQTNVNAQQAPNRATIWSPNQAPRIDVVSKHPVRFVQRDLDQQPMPYAAIDLIAKEPVRYLHDTSIAVCDGNKESTLQGHPKVFINLDQPKAATCGYCGLRYAKDEFKELIEGGQQ